MNYFVLIVSVFILLTVFLFLFVVVKRRKVFSEKDVNFIKMNWFRILDLASNDLSKAVLDADKLLDFALSKKGKTGSVGEKLKKSASLFKDIDSVWYAHKIRNRVAHEIKGVDSKELKSAIFVYKKALIDLGVNL